MKTSMILFVLETIYIKVLRDLIKEKIDNPDSEIDDRILAACDALFNCNK